MQILAIDNVIFAFFDHRVVDRKRCCFLRSEFNINQCVHDLNLPGVITFGEIASFVVEHSGSEIRFQSTFTNEYSCICQ